MVVTSYGNSGHRTSVLQTFLPDSAAAVSVSAINSPGYTPRFSEFPAGADHKG